MGPIKHYLAEEVALDHADGLITRRQALKRLALLGVGAAASTSLLAACASDDPPPASATSTDDPTASPAESVETEDITFDGPDGELIGAWAAAASDPQGGVLVIHENKGLTDHIRNVAGRFAASGFSALALDLLSREGGTAAVGGEDQIGAALGTASETEGRFVADMKGGLDEIERRVGSDTKLAAIGFCFGGGMIWRLLDAGDERLGAAAPFYGPPPKNPDFRGLQAAVLGVFAELDSRINNGNEMAASRDEVAAALQEADITHEVLTVPGVDHAFFNDTGERYNAARARTTYDRVISWFEQYLA